MLTIRIHNTGEGSNENANYEYWVFVNNREIESGEISGHNRNDGWAALVKSISERHLTKRSPDARKSAPKSGSKTSKGSAKPARG